MATCNGFLYAVGGHEAPATNPTCSRFECAERYCIHVCFLLDAHVSAKLIHHIVVVSCSLAVL